MTPNENMLRRRQKAKTDTVARRWRFGLACVSGPLLIAASAACAWSAPQAAPPVPAAGTSRLPVPITGNLFSALEDKDTHRVSAGTIRYDFGQVKATAVLPIEHTFVLRNNGKAAVLLDHLQPSCGCTSAVVGSGTAASLGADVRGTVIAPGQQIEVHTSVDPKRLSPGLVDKFVSVFVQGQAAPALTLEVTGTLQGGVVFSRGVLDFGSVRAGSQTALPLTVTLEMPLLPAGARPRLISSNPDVVLEQQPGGSTAEEITAKEITAEDTKTRVQTYSVRLAPRPTLGTLTGMVSVVSGDKTDLQLLSPVTVPILGEVTGAVTAAPSAFAFGMVPSGLGATQQIQLAAASHLDLQTLKLTCASRFLSLRLLPSPAHRAGSKAAPSGAAHARLEVTLNPKTPVGTLETQIVVQTPAGEKLILPVYAYVVHTEHVE